MPKWQKRWYVESVDNDAHTNKVYAGMLEAENAGLYNAEHGKTVRAWECSEEQAKNFLDNRSELNLKVQVWHSKMDGTLKRWNRPRVHNDLRLVLT